MQDDLDRVIAGLTEAQREVLMAAWEYPDFHRNGPQVSLCPVAKNAANERALADKGVCEFKAIGGPRLSSRGLAIRNRIKELETNNARDS